MINNRQSETEMNKYESNEYKQSRVAYIVQCVFEYFVSLLVTDVFFAKLLSSVGVSDAMIGIISSLISFSFLFQLFSLILVRKIRNAKKTVIIFDSLSQVFFMALYIIPFFKINKSIKIILIVTCVVFAYFLKYLISSICFKWANSYVNPTKRGAYSATKEMISIVSGIVFSLAIGWVMDKYEEIGNLTGSFLFIAVVMLILNICNLVSLLLIKKDSYDEEKIVHSTPELKNIVKNTLFNKSFIHVVIMYSLWEMARYMSVGFMGTFKTKDLLLSVGAVQVINMMANLIRFLLSIPFGRYSDKKSYAKGMELAFFIAAIGFCINMFTTQTTVWCIVVFTIFYNLSLTGTNQNGFNIIYSYVDCTYFVYALAIKNSVAGLLSFFASVLGGEILKYIQAKGNVFLGMDVYGQQILSLLSLVLVISAILYNRLIIQKQKVMIQ